MSQGHTGAPCPGATQNLPRALYRPRFSVPPLPVEAACARPVSGKQATLFLEKGSPRLHEGLPPHSKAVKAAKRWPGMKGLVDGGLALSEGRQSSCWHRTEAHGRDGPLGAGDDDEEA